MTQSVLPVYRIFQSDNFEPIRTFLHEEIGAVPAVYNGLWAVLQIIFMMWGLAHFFACLW